jgi:hypothetical protein
MSLDGTIREANIRDSVKKYFVDNLYTVEGIQISFDRGLSTPKVQGIEVDKWYAITFGSIEIGTLASCMITLFCCTKQDAEGFKLAQLRDKALNYLIDNDATDGRKRITLYRSHPTEAWVNIGGMVVDVDSESPSMEADDGSKLKTISINLRWAARC